VNRLIRKLFGKSKSEKLQFDLHEYEVIVESFDVEFYFKEYPDVEKAEVDPIEHYILFGVADSRNPNNWFNTSYYLNSNTDVRDQDINPFYHYLCQGKEEGRSPQEKLVLNDEAELSAIPEVFRNEYAVLSKFFDQTYYLNSNQDIDFTVIDPQLHFMEFGWREFRDPCETFSVEYYLKVHEDVANSGINPFLHYIYEGMAEGRSCLDNTNVDGAVEDIGYLIEVLIGEFDPDYYCKMYPDVEQIDIDPLEHYIKWGSKEGRDPTANFSTQFYLDDNPDVVEAGVNPFYHYIVSGQYERRHPRRPGGEKSDVIYSLRPLSEGIEAWKSNKRPDCLELNDVESLLSELGTSLVLSISHDVYLDNIGGVQVCIGIEESSYREGGADYIHLAPFQALPVLSASSISSGQSEFLHLSINGKYKGVVEGNTLITAVDKTELATVTPIIHALHGHSPELLINLFSSFKVEESIFWVHDFFSVCEGYNLLRNTIEYCGAPKVTSKACNLCIYGKGRQLHTERLDSLLNAFPTTVICPSEAAKDEWLLGIEGRLLSNISSTIVINHIALHESTKEEASDDIIRVAFLGYPSFHKGGVDFKELVHQTVTKEKYEYYHIGKEGIKGLPIKFIECSVTKEDQWAMVNTIRENKIDYVFIPAKWPETFNIACYEAISAGAKIISYPDTGNISRYLSESEHGILIDDVNLLVEKIQAGELIKPEFRQNYSITYSNMSADI